ncbi:hypothetical protein V7659_31460, partial [Neobacillus drentensis]|uniref:hypothetical protein n=1 Tax=Neobacillus drentensis TaxID=220684 RepID=UPI002FFFA546
LKKRFENNYTDDLGEEFYKAKLYLHKLMELYAVWPFVIKDILIEHSHNPEEFVKRIPQLSKDVEAYKNQIKQKWNNYEYQVPSTIQEHSEIVEKLQEAIENTIELRRGEYVRATEGDEDDEEM